MKRFTNPPHLTSSPSAVLIKPSLCRGAPRHSSHLMQAQQSLFQSAFKDPNQRTAHGVKKSIPFLNLWAPSQDVQRYQEQQKRDLNSMASATSFYDFKPLDKKGAAVPLDAYKGKVVLIVNTASKCGFTPQYQGLESLYKKISASHPDQFVILGFPCNQFGGQEPGSDEEIQSFCQLNYGVSFPIMGKTDVNGDKANPLFEWLKEEKPGLLGLKRVKWNFEKWLVGKDGKVRGRWASTTKPESLEKEVLSAINEA